MRTKEHELSVTRTVDRQALRELIDLTEHLADEVLADLRRQFDDLDLTYADPAQLARIDRMGLGLIAVEFDWFGVIGAVELAL